jgi:phage pi2 protein 07
LFKNIIKGKVVKGYRVASGISKNSPYPEGSVKMQLPFFKQRGLDLYRFYPATLNISIFPKKFELKNPKYRFRKVKWSADQLPEDFSFSACKIIHKDIIYDGYVYYPHPETKSDHFHDGSTVEIITKYLKDIYYNSELKLIFDQNELVILN